MNNPFLNPEDIISGTESAYVLNEPLPVLNLYDRLKSKYKLSLNKNIENYSSASTIKSTLKNLIIYEDLTLQDLKLLYAMIDVWIHEASTTDLIFGANLFEK